MLEIKYACSRFIVQLQTCSAAGILIADFFNGVKLFSLEPGKADMRITVKLFASLARFSPTGMAGKSFEMNLPESANLHTVVTILGIPSEEIKIPFVNGLIRDLDWELKPGDEVGIFPPIGGG
jgi:molybdopterin synthase sulfur carrier subunit